MPRSPRRAVVDRWDHWPTQFGAEVDAVDAEQRREW
jgi:hypothetical protein